MSKDTVTVEKLTALGVPEPEAKEIHALSEKQNLSFGTVLKVLPKLLAFATLLQKPGVTFVEIWAAALDIGAALGISGIPGVPATDAAGNPFGG